MPEITSAAEARQFLLGADFKPRETDIDTPQILLDKGFPPQSLRLVGFAATRAQELSQAANGNQTLYFALCVCACVRWRADGSAIFAITDAPQLCAERDVQLLNDLAVPVRAFLGLGPAAVTDAKNGSEVQVEAEAGPKSAGGGASPLPSDSPLPEPVSEPSSTATS